MSTEVGSLQASLTLDLSNFKAGISEATMLASELASQLRATFSGDVGIAQMAAQVREAMEAIKLLRAELSNLQAMQNAQSGSDMFAQMRAHTASLPSEIGAVQSALLGAVTAAQQLSAAMRTVGRDASTAARDISVMQNTPTGTSVDFTLPLSQLQQMSGLVNEITSAFNSIGTVDLSTGEVTGGDLLIQISNLVEGYREISRELERIIGLSQEASTVTRQWANQMRAAMAPFSSAPATGKAFNNQIRQVNKNLQTTKGYAISIKGILGGIVISQAFYSLLNIMEDLVRGAMDFSQNMQDAGVAFEYLMRDAEVSSDAFLNALKDIALMSPLDTTDLTSASRKLMAMGFSAKSTIPALQILTDTAAVFSNGAGDMANMIDHIALAFGQMIAAGKVSAQELRQLYNAGLPVYELLSEGLGISMEMAKNAGHYNIDSAEAVFAILTQLQERYGGAAEALSKTMSGSLQVIRESLQQLLSYAWADGFDLLTQGMNALASRLQALVKITQAYDIGGLFQAIVPENLWGDLRKVLSGILQLIDALRILAQIVASIVAEALTLAAKIGGVVLPILGNLVGIVVRVTQSALVAVPWLKTLFAVIALLAVAGVIAKGVTLLAKAIYLLTGAKAAVAAITGLVKALITFVAGASPVTLIILGIAAAFLAVVAASSKARAAIASFFGKVSGAFSDFSQDLGIGFHPDDLVMPDFTPPDTGDFSDGLQDMISGMEDLGDAEEAAGDKAKKAQKNLQSFDEVYQIEEPDSSGDSLGSTFDDMMDAIGGLGDLSYDNLFDWTGDWATDWGNLTADLGDFTSDMMGSLDDLSKTFEDFWKTLTGGGAFEDALAVFDVLSGILALLGKTQWAGALQVLEGITKIFKALKSISEEGINFDNIMLLVDGLGDVAVGLGLITGNFNLVGIGLILDGINSICTSLRDIVVDGINIEGILGVVEGLGKILAGVGFLSGNKVLAGGGLILTGITGIIKELAGNWEAIRSGDWSGVDKVALIVSGLEVLGGLLIAIRGFTQIKAALDTTKAVKALSDTASTLGGLNTVLTGSDKGSGAGGAGGGTKGGLSSTLTSLAKNMGLIIVIIAEVAAAALLVVGAVILLGEALQQVAESWSPVIEQGGLTATAMTLGVGILVSVGVACKLLGQQGPTLIADIGKGTAILAEISLAADLLLAEVWAMGELLQQIIEAWQPVLDNGETAVTATATGVALLIAVGAACAALGAASSLASNIAVGTAILAEMSLATDLFLAEVWAMGELLQQIIEAWQPVLDNGETAVTAITLGTVLLVAVGAACAALGVATTATGGLLPLAVGLGTAILLELSVAADLFLAEVWVIGELLQKIIEAWQPVLDNGDTCAQAIALGTGLLIAVGAACAALGVASVASVGLLPLAIALGTALLVELSAAVVALVEALADVAAALRDRLAPELDSLNAILPGLTTDMDHFVTFMSEFATEVASYTDSMGGLTWSSIVQGFQKFFAGDPIADLADDVQKIYEDVADLNSKLSPAIDELRTAVRLMKDYNSLMRELQLLTEENGAVELKQGMLTNLKEVGKALVLGLIDGIEELKPQARATVEGLADEILDALKQRLNSTMTTQAFTPYGANVLEGIKNGIRNGMSSFSSWLTSNVSTPMQNWFTQNFATTKFNKSGTNVIEGLKTGIKTGMSTFNAWLTSTVGTPVQNWFTQNFAATKFEKSGTNAIEGVKNGIKKTMSSMSSWLNSNVSNPIQNTFNSAFKTTNFEKHGSSMIEGFKNGVKKASQTLDDWLKSNFVDEISRTFDSAFSTNAFVQYGTNIIQGMIKGLENNEYQLDRKVQSICNGIRRDIENSLEIHSPSRFTLWIGQMLMTGMSNGITQNARKLMQDATNVSQGIADALTVQEVPTYDMTDMVAPIVLDPVQEWADGVVSIIVIMLNQIQQAFNALQLYQDTLTDKMQNTLSARITPIAAAEQFGRSYTTTGTTQSVVTAALSEETIMRLSRMTAEALYEYLAPMLANMDPSSQEGLIAYVGTLIADDRSLRQLEKKLKVIRIEEERRRK